MLRFVIRRTLSTTALLFAISVLTFLIFFAFPSSNPAAAPRRAHRDAAADRAVETEWGFNKPIYVQYVKMMEKIFDGSVTSYTQGLNVDHEIWHGPAADGFARRRRRDHLVPHRASSSACSRRCAPAVCSTAC